MFWALLIPVLDGDCFRFGTAIIKLLVHLLYKNSKDYLIILLYILAITTPSEFRKTTESIPTELLVKSTSSSCLTLSCDIANSIAGLNENELDINLVHLRPSWQADTTLAANTVLLKTTKDNTDKSTSQPSIKNGRRWPLMTIGSVEIMISSNALGTAHACCIRAAQFMDQKWAVMPIAEGILDSLEQLGDVSKQWSSIVPTPIQWEAWSTTEHIHPSTPWHALWTLEWSASAKRDKPPKHERGLTP